MHVCLILSKSDWELIRLCNYSKLSSPIIETLKAIAVSSHINIISFSFVDNIAEHTQKPDIRFIYLPVMLIAGFFRKAAFIMDIVDAWINKFDLSTRTLSSFEHQILLRKMGDIYKLRQTKSMFYSYTTFENSRSAKSADFDFLLHGSGLKIEKGEILNEFSKFGTLSLHHGNNRFNRGLPVGFWEVFYREESGITAQFITTELDGGDVIYTARLRTLQNATANRANIFRNTSAVLQVAFSVIAQQAVPPVSCSNKFIQEFDIYTRELLTKPSSILMTFVSFKGLTASLFNLMTRRTYLFFLSRYKNTCEKWAISLSTNFKQRLSSWSSFYPLKSSPGSNDWVADPFFMSIDGVDYLLYEYYVWKSQKGVIAYSKINHDFSESQSSPHLQYDISGILLENDRHLSYPYTFNIAGLSYFIPENNSNGANLYRLEHCVKNTHHITAIFVRKLLDGFCIDPSFIRLNGFDYLFVTRLDESEITLHLFYCRDITTDKLILHPSSPLCVDHSLGRSAGRITVESEDSNVIVRPSQIMKNTYGEGILLSKYKLTQYECKFLGIQKKIKPTPHSIYSKLHHFDFHNGMTAVDYVVSSI